VGDHEACEPAGAGDGAVEGLFEPGDALGRGEIDGAAGLGPVSATVLDPDVEHPPSVAAASTTSTVTARPPIIEHPSP
jgi:hypothetical protein